MRRPMGQGPGVREHPPMDPRERRLLWMKRAVGSAFALVLAPVLVMVVGEWLSSDPGDSSVGPPGPPGPSPSKPAGPDFDVLPRLMDEPGCTAFADALTSLEDRAELSTQPDVAAVIKRNNGVRAAELNVSVSLQGGDRALTIESIDIEPRTPRPTAPLNGSLICEPSSGGVPKIELYADMDAVKPTFRGKGPGGTPYFRDNAITLTPHEQVPLHLTFSARRGYRAFELVIHYAIAGTHAKRVVPAPEGSRWAVTALNKTYGSVYDGTLGGPFEFSGEADQCGRAPKPVGC
ncbi:hypothetical protein ACPYPG_10035 [Streptomyces sp. FR-108]|uniref:hypothetical protein n=1 Tax=Streptomyces sp. FR-108 TaxID=3416665 RepID=UPI003CE96A51